jgi:membrane protease YdiL (CAAX protease family)
LPLAAAAQSIEPEVLGGAPAPSVLIEEIDGELRESLDRALARYDAAIEAEPHRVAARISRCELIEAFLGEFEYVTFSDDVYERSERCETDLRADFSDHPEVQLWQLKRTYGDEERLAAGQELLRGVDAYGWTAGQRGRLFTELANTSDRLDLDRRFRERTAEYARQALEHDIRADVRLVLAVYFQEVGNGAAALEALTSPFDGHDPEDNWYRVRKMTVLAELGEREAVLAEHAELATAEGYYDRAGAAAALKAVGELELAERELTNDGPLYGTDGRQRFALALERGTAEEAHAIYQSWRDIGWGEDPVGINRFALFLAHPGLPWRARDALGLLGAVVLLAAIVAVWCVPLALIHYRGLVTRARSATPMPLGGLRLRDAWLGLAAFSLSSFIALYAIGPIDLFVYSSAPWGFAADPPQLAKMVVVESTLGIVFLAAVVYALRAHFARWWSTDWSIARCVLVGAGVALIFRLPMFAMMLAGTDMSTALRIDDALWQIIVEVDEIYGAAAALFVLAVAAPVGEELVFRGLLLRAALRDVSFPLANVVQAALFAAVHFDLEAAPFLFLFGLTAGWLARRSGGLLAPLVMHAVLNFVAAVLVVF